MTSTDRFSPDHKPGECHRCGGKYQERIPGRPEAVVAILPWQTECYRCSLELDRAARAKREAQ